MTDKTIDYIKIVFEKELDAVCRNKCRYKEDYIRDLLDCYKEFVKLYGEDIDGMILEYYKERLGVENE